MEPFHYMKSAVQNFRMESCCWIFPIRIGLIMTALFNATLAAIGIIATANGSFNTVLIQVQTKLNEDAVTTAVPMMAYITEVGFSVLCLCGIFRKDRVLLRVYMYYCIAALVLSLMVYSIVILAIDVLTQIAMIAAIIFQVYVLLLVRSAIVEIIWEQKQSELPTLVMSTLIEKEKALDSNESHDSKKDELGELHDDDIQVITVDDATDDESKETKDEKNDVENAPEGEHGKKNGHKKEVEVKLETVNEEASP